MQIFEWKSYHQQLEELETIKSNLTDFQPVNIEPELVKLVYTNCYSIATLQNPILATEGIYNCVGLLAYDLSKNYAFLAHSYGNENYGFDNSLTPSQIYGEGFRDVPRGIMPGSSIHAVEMLDSLSKEELYRLKIAIIVGAKPNIRLVNSMINTIIFSMSKRIFIESIRLFKPFIEGIHTMNDINHGKNANYYDLLCANRGKEIIINKITGEKHSYSENRGSSIAFNANDGKILTYNSDSRQYYTYNDLLSIEIKIR